MQSAGTQSTDITSGGNQEEPVVFNSFHCSCKNTILQVRLRKQTLLVPCQVKHA